MDSDDQIKPVHESVEEELSVDEGSGEKNTPFIPLMLGQTSQFLLHEGKTVSDDRERELEVVSELLEVPVDENASGNAISNVENNVEELEVASEQNSAEVSGGETVEERPPNPNLKWYVVNAYSGFELKAKKALEERIRTHKMEDFFGGVHVPEEMVVELVRGEKKTSSRKFFPGYMLVQMEMNQDTWHLVKETSKISGFVGDAMDPMPLSDEEVARITNQVEEGAASPRARMNFEQGDPVKVIDGPFADFNGTIEEVRPEKGKVKVLISIFGRATPVELDFIQVEKC